MSCPHQNSLDKICFVLFKHYYLHHYICRLIYPGFEITQFFVHLILRIIENPLTRAFADDCQLHQLRRPGDVVWDAVRDGDDASVPVDKAMDVIRRKLEEDESLSKRTPLSPRDIITLLERCLKCTYFLYKGQYYLQVHGAAMGSLVSPIVCNLYMENFEQIALEQAENPPRWWKRYVDDTYTVLRKDQAQKFTDYLNTVDEDIKWTTEGEVVKDIEGLENRTERGLAFLDTLSVINEDGAIKTRVYRKDTHTDQYLNFESNHPLEHERSSENIGTQSKDSSERKGG